MRYLKYLEKYRRNLSKAEIMYKWYDLVHAKICLPIVWISTSTQTTRQRKLEIIRISLTPFHSTTKVSMLFRDSIKWGSSEIATCFTRLTSYRKIFRSFWGISNTPWIMSMRAKRPSFSISLSMKFVHFLLKKSRKTSNKNLMWLARYQQNKSVSFKIIVLSSVNYSTWKAYTSTTFILTHSI